MTRRAMSAEQMLDYLQTNVHRDGDCLQWAGPVFSKGLPRANWGGKAYMARRLMFKLAGKRLGTKIIIEKCDSRLCMNFEHLVLAPASAGMEKAIANGNFPVGAVHSLRVALGKAPNARLPITEARTVLELRANGHTLRAIGERYNVHPTRVRSAIRAWARAGAA